jgi:hypothetical protein
VPLSKIQSDILRLLAAHRNPESYIAGALPINRDTSRFSDDIDVFHAGRRRGHWLSSPEIGSAMLERR